MLERSRLELLSPAKDADTGIAAIDHGADAVYIGGPSFGARQAAGNSLDDIARLCDYAHRFDVKIFLTLNTLFTDEELPRARRLAFDAAAAGVDVLIVQDMGLLMGPLPNIELHASTQCDIRTPEKAAFLEKVGFSQMVLARELSLEDIARVRAQLQHARIEYFIHGALCVSYSGQCYISQAMTGRSANRGECAQFCRLPYDVTTLDGQVLAQNAHVLSLKDNNQTANLEALIDAGVSSFKIEGRLKDQTYVKNITAHYRRELDAIMARRPEFTRSSSGVSTLRFTPDPGKSFNRQSTDYFIHGRLYDQPYELVDVNTPKNAGRPVGTVLSVSPGVITVKLLPEVTLNNGDGLTYVDAKHQLMGLAINRVEATNRNDRVRLLLRRREIPLGLKAGDELRRNRDTAFIKALSGETAERRLPVAMRFRTTPTGIALTISDASASATVERTMALETASNPERNRETLARNLFKLGDTPLSLSPMDLDIPEELTAFIPASVANDLRREAVEAFLLERLRHREPSTRAHMDDAALYPEKLLGFMANVANDEAKAFYEQHGARITAPAFEIVPVEHAALMTCRHCIRATLKLCPKMLKAFPELLEQYDRSLFKPDPLVLTDSAGDRFTAVFHCKATPCTMTIER